MCVAGKGEDWPSARPCHVGSFGGCHPLGDWRRSRLLLWLLRLLRLLRLMTSVTFWEIGGDRDWALIGGDVGRCAASSRSTSALAASTSPGASGSGLLPTVAPGDVASARCDVMKAAAASGPSSSCKRFESAASCWSRAARARSTRACRDGGGMMAMTAGCECIWWQRQGCEEIRWQRWGCECTHGGDAW